MDLENQVTEVRFCSDKMEEGRIAVIKVDIHRPHHNFRGILMRKYRQHLRVLSSILKMPNFSLSSKLLAAALSTVPKSDFLMHWCRFPPFCFAFTNY